MRPKQVYEGLTCDSQTTTTIIIIIIIIIIIGIALQYSVQQ